MKNKKIIYKDSLINKFLLQDNKLKIITLEYIHIYRIMDKI